MRAPTVLSLSFGLALGLATPIQGEAGRPAYAVLAEVRWRIPVAHAGKSSPRGADLNADGVDDVVLGAGVEDHWGEVVALDGRTGRVLWNRRVGDEVLSATPFLDVDGDRIADVFVGGRSRLREVLALSGKDGTTLWRLLAANPDSSFPPTNFVNLSLIDDRNGDGLADLLVVQSGGKDTRRLAARFYRVGSADGTLLASGVAPDGNESYSLPLFEGRSGEPPRLYVGTGGETLSGNLLKLSFPALEEEWRVRAIGGGFIGSPVLADLDGDGKDDIIAAGMNGSVYRVDADAGSVRWRSWKRPAWTYVSPAAGRFDDRAPLDVVVSFNRGVFPKSEGVLLQWLDGAAGRVITERSVDERFPFTAGSPLVVDLDRDGRDETVFVFGNEFLDSLAPDSSHRLLVFDGGAERSEVLSVDFAGYSIATPRIADLDGNGKLDVVHASSHEVVRIELTITGASPPGQQPQIRWGEFRGPNGAGIDRR